MKNLRIYVLFATFAILSTTAISQNFENMQYGTDTTLEIASWNIETFPKNGTTADYVKQIIDSLDIDLLAIQEVSDTNVFKQMVADLDGYVGYFESSWFAGLAYIYKSDIIQINDIYEIYTTYLFWDEFPRSPVVMDFTYNDERMLVINNHLKCCGDEILDLSDNDDEETRRLHACILLKSYIDVYFPEEKVIVLGDYNDELTDDENNNVFQTILDDEDNYLFVDYDIAIGESGGWSYPTWPSHIDHILITDNLFNDYSDPASSVDVIKVDEYMAGGWSNYEWYVSDHRPVAVKLNVTKGSNITENRIDTQKLLSYPNPFIDNTMFIFEPNKDPTNLIVFDSFGQKVLIQEIDKKQTSFYWEGSDLSSGVYFAVLCNQNVRISSTRLVKIR